MIFEHRKDGKVYDFQPNGSGKGYTVYVQPLTQWDASASLVLEDPSTWYLVDSNPPAMPPLRREAVVVYVPSCNPNHTKEAEKSGAESRWLPPWSLAELQAAATVTPVSPDNDQRSMPLPPRCLTSSEVERRYRCFGGTIRQVFGKKATVERAVRLMQQAAAETPVDVLSNGTIDILGGERELHKSSRLFIVTSSAPYATYAFRTVLM